MSDFTGFRKPFCGRSCLFSQVSDIGVAHESPAGPAEEDRVDPLPFLQATQGHVDGSLVASCTALDRQFWPGLMGIRRAPDLHSAGKGMRVW